MNLPNKITICRFVVSIVVVVLLFPYEAYGIDVLRIGFAPVTLQPVLGSIEGVSANSVPIFGFSILQLIAMLLFVFASVTDSIDGHLARKNNQITNFGKLMDPLADKFLVDGTLIMLCFRGLSEVSDASGNSIPFGLFMPAIIVVFMVLRDMLVDGFKMLSAKNGIVIAANNWGKAKTVAQMIVIPFYIMNGFPFYYLFGIYTEYLMIGLMCVVLALSLVSGGIYVYQGRDLFKNSK